MFRITRKTLRNKSNVFCLLSSSSSGGLNPVRLLFDFGRCSTCSAQLPPKCTFVQLFTRGLAQLRGKPGKAFDPVHVVRYDVPGTKLILPQALRHLSVSSSHSTAAKNVNLNASQHVVEDLKDRENAIQNTSEIDANSGSAVTDNEIDAELLRYDYETFEEFPHENASMSQLSKKSLPISFERGLTGVFDVEDLIALLEDENAQDIRVLPVPPEYHYVDYLVVATGRSTRHLRAMAEFVKWMYKRRHRPGEDPPSVRIEGEQCKDWLAIDLGNIAVHLFLHDTRVHYDLETLWTEGYTPEAVNAVEDITQRDEFSFDAELERLRKLKSTSSEAIVDDGKTK